MTLVRLLLLFFSLLGIFISGGIFFRKNDLKHRSLALIILLLSTEYLNFLYGTSQFAMVFPYFVGIIFFPIGFLYGPILMIHIKSILGINLTWKAVLHFLPCLIIVLSLWDLYAIDGGLARAEFIQDNFFYRFLYYNYIRAFHISIYGFAILFYYFKRGRSSTQADPIYAYGILTIYFISGIAVSLLTEFADGYRDFVWHYLISSCIALFIAYLLYVDPSFLKTIKKYLASSLSEEDMKKISDKMNEKLVGDKMFLKRDLSLTELANAVNESSHRISQTLSVFSKKNFNDYINQHRISYAKELLVDSNFAHYKIEAIAIDSGFNNKVTFYKAFSKETGTTPTAYKKHVKGL